MIKYGAAWKFQPVTVKLNNLSCSKRNIKPQATKAEQAQLMKMVFVSFLAITSIANKKPASGLPNKVATPAATPAQINSVL